MHGLSRFCKFSKFWCGSIIFWIDLQFEIGSKFGVGLKLGVCQKFYVAQNEHEQTWIFGFLRFEQNFTALHKVAVKKIWVAQALTLN